MTTDAQTRTVQTEPQAAERNMAVVRTALTRRLEQGTAGRREVLDPSLYTSDFRRFGPARHACGGDGQVPVGEVVFDSFTEPRVEIRHMEAIGDRVITHCHFRGRHSRRFQGHPATGREMHADAVLVHRMRDGRIAEEWSVVRWQ